MQGLKETLGNTLVNFGVSVAAFSAYIIERVGYWGIFLLMAVESSFFLPIPSEVIIAPAGYLTVQGDMNIVIVIICGTLGSLVGATVNYTVAYRYGRQFFDKYGRYIFLPAKRIAYMDHFFLKHGEITTFLCRLIPGVRQCISFSAGIARMSYTRFAIYTALGAGVWVTMLAFIGKAVGDNIDTIKAHVNTIFLVKVPIFVVIIIVYMFLRRYFAKKANAEIAIKQKQG